MALGRDRLWRHRSTAILRLVSLLPGLEVQKQPRAATPPPLRVWMYLWVCTVPQSESHLIPFRLKSVIELWLILNDQGTVSGLIFPSDGFEKSRS